MMRKLFHHSLALASSRQPHITPASKRIFQYAGDDILCDFTLLNDPKAAIESIIVLNNELNKELFGKCLQLTNNVILADGGANHFHDTEYRDSEKVKAIVGDFDCIKQEVSDYYNDRKIPLEYTSTLDDNDFCKALEKCLSQGWKTVFCFGAFGGRMDQTLSGMHYSEKYSKMYPELEIVLLGQSNMMFHIKKNIKYRIRITEDLISRFGCGIITFGKAEYVETSGFKWNLGH